MTNRWEIIKEVTTEAISGAMYAVQFNMRYLANFVNIGTPYLMYVLGQNMALSRGEFAVGGEIFVPVVLMVLTYYIRQISNKVNKGTRIPIPQERFTEVDEDGEVSVRQDRISEMLLYMADLEDWMARKGWL